MSTDNQKFINESDSEKNQNNEANPISDSGLAIFNLLSQLDSFKDIEKDYLKDFSEKCCIKNFKIGWSLSTEDIIPNNIYIICKGFARLLYIEKTGADTINRPQTLVKLGPGSFIGLSSYLRGQACEEVTASSEIQVISIKDKDFLALFKKQISFKLWCINNIQPGEITGLLYSLIKKSIRTDIQIRTAFNLLMENTKLVSIKNEELQITEKNITNILISSNVKDLKVDSILDSSKKIKTTSDFPPRIISIPKLLIDQFLYMKEEVPSTEKIKFSTEFPEKTSLNFDYENSKKKSKLIKANGPIHELLACLQMISNELDIPFRKDTIEKIIRDEIRRKPSFSMEFCGSLLSMMGLNASGVKIPPSLGGRLKTPSIIFWNEKFVLLRDSNTDGLEIFSPQEGIIKIPTKELTNTFKDGIPLILIEKTNTTPNKKFGLQWFWPSIKQYKSTLLLVLLASFLVQLLLDLIILNCEYCH